MTTLALGEELTIQCAADVTAEVTAALRDAPTVLVLDLGGVEELDTAGLQVLLWASHEAAGQGIALEVHASAAAREVLELVGRPDLPGLVAPGASTATDEGGTR